jgi:hypothetical protein
MKKYRMWIRESKTMEYSDKLSSFFADVEKYDRPVMEHTGFADQEGRDVYYSDVYRDDILHMNSEVTELTVAHWLIESDKMNSPMNYVKVIGNVYANPKLDRHFASRETARLYREEK